MFPKSTYFILLCTCWIAACNHFAEFPSPTAANVLPDAQLLAEGPVWGLYQTRYDRGSNYSVSSQLEYIALTRTSDSTLLREVYSPAFALQQLEKLTIDATGIRIDEYTSIQRKDTLIVRPDDAYELRFDSLEAKQQFAAEGWSQTKRLKRDQSSTWDGNKTIRYTGSSVYVDSASNQTFERESEVLYVPAIGPVKYVRRDSTFTYTKELLYQLSPKQVTALKQQVPQRVAFIHPDSALIDAPINWQLCRSEKHIFDYYNPDPDITYPGGHYGLKKDWLSTLDLSAFAGESGYLTFRFIVNCEGRIGRMVTDEASLDFDVKRFPRKAVLAVAKSLQSLPTKWPSSPGRPNEPLADYYSYITLKFQDGELIDLLP